VISFALSLPFLNASGLAHAEGQRVQPAWAMLEATRIVAERYGLSTFAAFFTRDSLDAWLVPQLFDQPYLRKPPGTPWAIAIFGAIFGQTNAAARAMSACALMAMSLLSAMTAARWFAKTPRERGPLALVAGLACALLPAWYWYPPLARSAEIESLNHLWTFVTGIAIIELLLAPRHAVSISRTPLSLRSPRTIAWSLVLAFATAALLLTKGPASLPVLAGIIAACLWMRPRLPLAPDRRVAFVPVLVAIAMGAIVFGAWLLAVREVLARTHRTPITQEVGAFLFTPSNLLAIILLPFAALATTLPHSAFLLVFVRSRDAIAPRPDPTIQSRQVLARTLALALLLSLVLYACAGVSNNRYTLPAATLLPLTVAAAYWWLTVQSDEQRAFTKPPARAFLTFGAFLLAATIALVIYAEHRRQHRTSGEPDGARLGAILDGPAELWGDELLDLRPEIAMRAVDVARQGGHAIRARWKPLELAVGDPALPPRPPLPPVGGYLLLRIDAGRLAAGSASTMQARLPEFETYVKLGVLDGPARLFEPVFEGRAHNFEYRVYQRIR